MAAEFLIKGVRCQGGKMMQHGGGIIGWFLLLLGSWWVTAEPWHDALAFFSAAFLFTWAWLELTQGASPVRRVFGAMVLVYLLVSRLLFD